MQMGPGNMAPIRIDLHTLVRYWLVSPFTCAVLAALLLAAFWYFQATRDVAEQGNHWPVARTLAFLAGLLAVALAFMSSVAMLPYISFPVQVVQKLLLLMVGPPLLVLGAPLALAVETSSPRLTGRLLGVVRSTPLRALTHPVVVLSSIPAVSPLTTCRQRWRRRCATSGC
jgi:putative copper resistance protein D